MSENILTQYIFHKCVNFKWEDLEQKFLFSIFFLGDRGAFVAQNIIEIDIQ